jgi:hypothetical protein
MDVSQLNSSLECCRYAMLFGLQEHYLLRSCTDGTLLPIISIINTKGETDVELGVKTSPRWYFVTDFHHHQYDICANF